MIKIITQTRDGKKVPPQILDFDILRLGEKVDKKNKFMSDEQAESIVATIDDLKNSIECIDEAIDWLLSEDEPV